ncbi:MAG: tetratricopeptide repeat protein [Chloroflexi bacterium]|nr:tetratricopeptide repeat protein [Chloroflexota bacterium]
MSSPVVDNQLLVEGIDAARRGERAKARDKFTRYLRYDQKNEQAWLWMSSVVESDRERVYCLNAVLKLNPNNKTAKRGLALLGALPPEMRADLNIEVIGVTPETRTQPQARRGGLGFRRSRRLETLLIVTLLAVILGAGGFLAFNFIVERNRLANLTPPPTNTPTLTLTATATEIPSATPAIRTATPIVGANLTPVEFFLGLPATLTPTPPPFTPVFFAEEAYSRGKNAYDAGDLDLALSLFKDALQENKDNYVAHYYSGEIYLQKKDYNRAFSSFTSALRINSNFAPAHLGHGRANFALGGNPINDYEQAKSNEPAWAEPYIAAADFYISRGNRENALVELELAQGLAPDNVEVLWRLAEQYFITGQTEDARAALETGLDVDPTALDLHRVKARLALATDDFSTAQEAMNLYLAYRPDDAEGWVLSGKAFLGLGNTPTALTSFSKAIELDPRLQEAFVARGELQLVLADAAAARQDFDSAIRLGSTVELRLRIGKAYYEGGDYASAIPEFRRAASSAPDLFEPNFWLGLAQIGAEAYADATHSLTNALDQATTETEKFDALYQRGLAYNGAGESESAVADLRASLQLNVTDRDEDRTAATELLADLGGPGPDATNTLAPTTPTP